MPYSDPSKQKQAQHESYIRNKDRIIESSINKIRATREWVAELKSNPCVDCGLSFHWCAMEFHHRDPKEKFKKISTMVTSSSRKKILEEIEKCDLLCSNCHRIREYFERNTDY